MDGGSALLTLLLPELLVVAAGCAALLCGVARDERFVAATRPVALGGLVLALLVLRGAPLAGLVPAETAHPHVDLVFDRLADFVRVSALIFGIAAVLVSWSQPGSQERGEYFAMLLFSLAGLMLVGPADDLVTLFLALELVSVPAYALVALSRAHPRALEAATKYFYLGALAAAVNAYGFSFLYGVMGGASLGAGADALGAALAAPHTPAGALATAGLVLSIGGLLFKIAAVPLHFYVADVYQGAASPVAGFLGFVPKLAGLAAIFKLVALAGWRTDMPGLFWLLWLVAAASMTFGNVLALRQVNIKRMLAYSGIAHSGYMLVGVLAGPLREDVLGDGAAAVLFYAVIYGLANLAAFAVLAALRARGQPCETLRDVAGLVRRHPAPALLLSLAMFTLMGLPPSAGFWGKMGLFGSALTAGEVFGAPLRGWMVALVILGVLNSALAAAYYLRVMAACLLYEAEETAEPVAGEAQQMGALLCAFLLLIFTFYPAPLLRVGQQATAALRGMRPAPLLRVGQQATAALRGMRPAPLVSAAPPAAPAAARSAAR